MAGGCCFVVGLFLVCPVSCWLAGTGGWSVRTNWPAAAAPPDASTVLLQPTPKESLSSASPLADSAGDSSGEPPLNGGHTRENKFVSATHPTPSPATAARLAAVASAASAAAVSKPAAPRGVRKRARGLTGKPQPGAAGDLEPAEAESSAAPVALGPATATLTAAAVTVTALTATAVTVVAEVAVAEAAADEAAADEAVAAGAAKAAATAAKAAAAEAVPVAEAHVACAGACTMIDLGC